MTDHRVQCRVEDDKVILIIDGVATPFPWELADIVSKSLTINARKAEEFVKANRIIADNALMQRSGANFGLSDNPLINGETIKEALHNKGIRRLLPWRDKKRSAGLGGIQSRGVVGAPTLRKRAAT